MSPVNSYIVCFMWRCTLWTSLYKYNVCSVQFDICVYRELHWAGIVWWNRFSIKQNDRRPVEANCQMCLCMVENASPLLCSVLLFIIDIQSN